jgi:hypothetical protein
MADNVEDLNAVAQRDNSAYLGKVHRLSESFAIIEKEALRKGLKKKYYIPISLKISDIRPFSLSGPSSLRYSFALINNNEKIYFDLTKDEAESIYLEDSTMSDEDIEKKRRVANRIADILAYLKFANPYFLDTRIIVPDEEESNPIQPSEFFNVKRYSEVLADIVKRSKDKYSIGIFGEWGSGKTTLMKLIEEELNPLVFVWNDIGTEEKKDNSADEKLKNILRAKFNKFNKLIWFNNAHFRKVGNSSSVITLGEKRSDNNFLSITLLDDKKNYTKNDDTKNDDTKDDKQAILRIGHQKSPYVFQATYEDAGDRLVVRENNILTVWFNAWRYESEENFALIPLMKTIAYAMGEHPIYKNLKNTILKGLAILGKDLLRHYALENFMTEKGIQEFEDNFTKKLAQSAEFDKDVIYFEGIKKIQEEMEKIISNKQDTKIVVFVDDLDRCSPNKALEVFESVKVFFDMPGFIFIMGLSQEALNTIIRAKFQNMGLSGITPEQYIRKIIQVEVQIPKWKELRIRDLIENKICPKLDTDLADKIKKKDALDLIMQNVIDGDPGVANPREVKRFINKFIIFLKSNNSIDLNDHKKYLIVQAFRKKWKAFYDNFFDSKLEAFPQRVKEWLDLKKHERETYLELIVRKRNGPYLLDEKEATHLFKLIRLLKFDTKPGDDSLLLSKKWSRPDFQIEDKYFSELKNLFKVDPIFEFDRFPNFQIEDKYFSELKNLLQVKPNFPIEDFSELKNLFKLNPHLPRKKDISQEEAKGLFLFNYEPFWREVIAMKMEFTDEKLWDFLECNKHMIFDDVKDLKRYKEFIDSTDVVIDTPRARIDMDLVSRRRDSYLDLWPRFKLLMSDFQDVEMRYHGRSFIKTYQHIQELFEKLQNWYYDRSGHMLMSDRTLNSYYILQRELHRILRNNTDGHQNDSPITHEELKRIREKVNDLFHNMSEDMIASPLS